MEYLGPKNRKEFISCRFKCTHACKKVRIKMDGNGCDPFTFICAYEHTKTCVRN
jgi:hypothetical protein